MRVLILAPHPFYTERGTPIAVDMLARALLERGDQVDILTYHEGRECPEAAARVHRIARPLFGIANIRPGFSWKKLVCDVYMVGSLLGLLRRNRYDVIHAVEESAFIAMALSPFFRLPYVFDVDSSMTQQIVAQHRLLRPMKGVLRWMESLPARGAAAVLPMCQALADDIARYRPRHLAVLKDVSLIDDSPAADSAEVLRETLAIDGPIVMYIGNLEPYQGVELLIDSFALAAARVPEAQLVIIGGDPWDIERLQARAGALGLDGRAHFLGKRPVRHIGGYMRQADVLASPRTKGVNTPMKIYSYLHSGTAVLATDLPTHTQVMDETMAMLAPPEREALADALCRLLDDPDLRRRLAAQARDYIEREHSYESFRSTLFGVYAHLEQALGIPAQARAL